MSKITEIKNEIKAIEQEFKATGQNMREVIRLEQLKDKLEK